MNIVADDSVLVNVLSTEQNMLSLPE